MHSLTAGLIERMNVGVLSSVPTVLTTWLGLHFGLVLVHFPDVSYRLQHWGLLSTVFFALGCLISPFWGFNKQQWSPSYLFLMDREGVFLDVFGYGTRAERIAEKLREILQSR